MYLAEALPAIIFMATAFFIPKSPRWLMQQGRKDEALAVLKLFNSEQKAKETVDEIECTLIVDSNVKFGDLFTKKLRTPLILAILVCFGRTGRHGAATRTRIA